MRIDKILYLFFGILFLFPFVVAGNETGNSSSFQNTITSANCSEQLNLCVGEYNSILEDYKAQNNCNEAFVTLKEFNKVLTEERDLCREEFGKLKLYRIGFYIFLILSIIASLILIISGKRGKKY